MKRMSKLTGALLGLAAAAIVTGCTDAKDMQIQELQEQLNDKRAENADLESRLAAALSAGDRANQLALSLQQQLDEARRQLAEGSAVAAELPPGWEGTEQIAWVPLAGDLLFDSGKASLKQGGAETVSTVAQQIKENFPDRLLMVIGHTDTDPIKVTAHLWEDNLDLSLNRAATVARELIKDGVAPERLIAAGQGEHNPYAPNDTKENKALNRRVEVVAVERQGG
jgi:outer membrane protein OmpA-like peptidoglycan-associated protein